MQIPPEETFCIWRKIGENMICRSIIQGISTWPRTWIMGILPWHLSATSCRVFASWSEAKITCRH